MLNVRESAEHQTHKTINLAYTPGMDCTGKTVKRTSKPARNTSIIPGEACGGEILISTFAIYTDPAARLLGRCFLIGCHTIKSQLFITRKSISYTGEKQNC